MSQIKIAIVQSNYIPWLGYFDLIASVDKFVFLDDVQYTSRDWRNRNRIIGPSGVQWITVPVNTHSITRATKINEVTVSDNQWVDTHLDQIRRNYKKSKFFPQIFPKIEVVYRTLPSDNLSEINRYFISELCSLLNIRTELLDSRDFSLPDEKNFRLIEICKTLRAGKYVSGPSARDYLNSDFFSSEGIEVLWFEYRYRNYNQLWGVSDQHVSILDSMFNVGVDCLNILKEAQ
jgi:hypothetical protein